MIFKSNDVLALDIGTQYVKFVLGNYKNKHLKINKMFEKVIDKDIILDGKVNDFKLLREFLRREIEDKSLKSKKITFTISGDDIIKRVIDIPVVDDADRESMIKYEMGQFLPEDIEKYQIQYSILQELTIENEINHKVLVVVIPKSICNEYFNLAKELNMIPGRLDIQSNSTISFINYNYGNFFDNNNNPGSVLVLDVGYSTTNVTVVEMGMFKFSRSIDIGTQYIESFLSDKSLKSDEITLEDISTMEDNGELLEVIRRWINEVERIIEYYKTRDDSKKICKVLLSGGGVFIDYVPRFFKEQVKIDVETMFLNMKFDLIDKDDRVHFPTYVNAIGALIDE